MKLLLGIDLGTSGIKTVLLTPEGQIAGSGSCELCLSTPRPGFAEQNPGEWWEACCAAVRQAAASVTGRPEVVGIGISGQMLGSVLLDRAGAVIEDCIIWMDQRAQEELAWVETIIGREELLRRTANYPLVSYWAPKLLWLRKHRPATYAKIDKVLFPKDYLKFKLTGVHDIDVTDATGSMLFDTARRAWDWELFDQLSLPRSFVPKTASESTAVIGSLRADAAERLGLLPGIPVVAGGGDQMCGAVGLGVVREGVLSSTIGTSGCVFSYSSCCITDQKPRAALSYCHSVPDAWCVYGCTLAAGGAYKWLRDCFFDKKHVTLNTSGQPAYRVMDELAVQARPGSEGLLFLPYLSGERTPHPDPAARGVFFGLSARHGISEICRSVLEGVAYSLRDTVEILREYHVPVDEVRAAGGGAASPLWLQLQADIFDAHIAVTNVAEAPAVGAAILAGVGAGLFDSVPQAADKIVRVVRMVEPERRNVPLYADYYETYRALYPALQDLFSSQAGKVGRWT
ncbi:xylulokinase [Anaerotruncus sp. AF02-27]|uniref:xylulokinase n=1 Tax=Anaerotruncus TaxID=244127 RepID=UPI000E554753|nr:MULTISPECIES: xylulokinase [Anaerotruncus]RGX54951.1 xylulokinase [Anaerotruncus sp. AF02-27]